MKIYVTNICIHILTVGQQKKVGDFEEYKNVGKPFCCKKKVIIN